MLQDDAAIYAYHAEESLDRLLDQVETCKVYCHQNGLRVVAVYQESGKRSEQERLLKDAAKGAFQRVVAREVNRLSRSNVQQQLIIAELQRLGITFHTVVDGSFDSGYKLLEQIVKD